MASTTDEKINKPISIAIVGYKGAGKSTLLSSITAAKPKIANYAFTTLTPQLGMVAYRDNRSFCIADLPGIIEGAAQGKGRGRQVIAVARTADMVVAWR